MKAADKMIGLRVFNVKFDASKKVAKTLLSSCEIVIDEEMMADYLEDSNALLCGLLEDHTGFCVLNYDVEVIENYDFNEA